MNNDITVIDAYIIALKQMYDPSGLYTLIFAVLVASCGLMLVRRYA